MTREELYRGIENIDEDLINDVNFSPKKSKNRKWILATAACLCVIIAAITIMNVNISTEVRAMVSREVVEQGEYYQITEIKRVFQNDLSKYESIQYNYVVYNGKFVLTSGISMKKPKVHNLSDTVICIEHSDYTQEYMTYCNLTINNADDSEDYLHTIYSKNLFFEFDGNAVFLEYWSDDEAPVICIDKIDGENWESLELEDGAKNINVSLNDDRDKITVEYTDAESNKQTKQIKVKNDKEVTLKIVPNLTDIKCLWKDTLIEQTDYTYTYKIDLTINRKELDMDYDEENNLYQCFIISNNKIIDEGCYIETPPQFILLEDDLLAMKFDLETFELYNKCRFYRLSTGEASKEYTEPLFTVNGKVAEPTCDQDKPDYLTYYDIFTGKEVDMSKYKLLDATVTLEGTIDIKYRTIDNKAKSEQLKLIYPPTENNFKAGGIDNIVKTYAIEDENCFYYLFFIYNKDGTEIVYYDYNMIFEPEITKVSDDVIRISTCWGNTVNCLRYYNIETDTLSEQYVEVMADSEETVVYLTYEDEGVCVNITDLFGTYTKKYVLDKKYTHYNKYFYKDMTLKDDKLIIKMTYLPYDDGEDEILEYPIK